MSGQNHVHLEGNLARDPEPGRGATAMARFAVAVSRYNSSTKAREAEFFNVTAFGKTAEFVLKYFAKGSGISLDGRLGINKWVDKAGQNRNDIQIVADEVNFPPKPGTGATGASHTPAPGFVPFEDEDEDPEATSLF